MLNPETDYTKLELEMLSFDKSSGCYEFDTICFWATKEGKVYTASDSGCSCPTPFEEYAGENQIDILQKLERIGSLEQAERIFDSWAAENNYHNKINMSDRNELSILFSYFYFIFIF